MKLIQNIKNKNRVIMKDIIEFGHYVNCQCEYCKNKNKKL